MECKVRMGARKVHGRCAKGARRCTNVHGKVHKGAQRCADVRERCTKGVQRCANVREKVRNSAQKVCKVRTGAQKWHKARGWVGGVPVEFGGQWQPGWWWRTGTGARARAKNRKSIRFE